MAGSPIHCAAVAGSAIWPKSTRKNARGSARNRASCWFREAWLEETDAGARRTYGPHVLGYSRVYFERGNAYHQDYDPWLKDVASASDLSLDHVLPDRVLCGSPETWIEQIADWREALEPEEIMLRLRHFQGPGIEQTLEVIRAIGAEVIPEFGVN